MDNPITVQTIVNSPLETVWECWTGLDHINGWAFATNDWQAEAIKNDLQPGGRFKTIMSAKDGSAGFTFTGHYTTVKPNELLEYILDDGRHVKAAFTDTTEGVQIIQSFEPESLNPLEMQRAGWQAFLDNFRKYTEDVAKQNQTGV